MNYYNHFKTHNNLKKNITPQNNNKKKSLEPKKNYVAFF